MGTPTHLIGRKVSLIRPGLGALLLSATLLQASAQVMSNLNSVATVSPVTQNGMYSWTVDGVNQLYKQWFWYAPGPAGGSTPPSSIDTMPLISDTQPTANTLNLTYQGAGFTLSIGYTLTGGSLGSGTADIGEAIRIVNQSGSYLPFQVYQYSDFDLNNQLGPSTIQISGPPRGGYNDAYQTMGPVSLSETVVTPPATYCEAGPEFATLAKLNNGVAPVVLNNNTVASGNVTWAFQWSLDIAPGGSALISKDKELQVPEPSALALLALAGAALALRKRPS